MLNKIPPIVLLFSLLTSCKLPLSQLDPNASIGDPDTISHSRMLDGNTGEMVVFAPGEDTRAVLNFIESLNGTYDPELGASAGYLYWIAGYRDGEEAFRLTFGSSIVNLDGKRYSLDCDVSSELDELYNMAPNGILLTMAMDDLAGKGDVPVNEIMPISVEPHLFSDDSPLFQDGSLMIQSDRSPFSHNFLNEYILKLLIKGEIVTYHGSGGRVVQAPEE